MTDTQALMTIAESAAALGCSERTVWRLVAAKRIDTVRFAGRRFVERHAVEALARTKAETSTGNSD